MFRRRPSRGRAEVGTEVGTRNPLILRGFPTCPYLSLLSLPTCAWRVTLGGGGEAGTGADLLLRDKREVGTGRDSRKIRNKSFINSALRCPYLPRRGRDRGRDR